MHASATAPDAPEATDRRERTPLERLRDVIAPFTGSAALWSWLAPLLVTALAAVLRLWNLALPHTLVFDETYYVKDAWSLVHLGYEGRWPDGANEAFVSGDTLGFLSEPSFVVHPPLGKWIIGAGMLLFGSESAFGWRIATAVAGIAAVLVLTLLVRRMTGSIAWGALAGFLLAIDGLGIVMSRVVLLDGLLMLFVLLGVWFILIDRDRTMGRIADAALSRAAGRTPSPWGPVLWRRPWVVAAGVAFGAAVGVKWSGVWVLAAFGLYLVVTDAFARYRAGFDQWGVAAVLRQGPATFLLLVPVAAVVYLSSWTGWLVTEGGYDRTSDPNPLVALWNYHVAMYNFHVGLSSGHTYASPAWQWPLMLRPTAMHFVQTDEGVDGCAWASGCAEHITSVANPAIWYPGMVAILVILYLFVRRPAAGSFRDWRFALALTGIAATYVPWLLYPERTIFQFYTVVMVPFVIIALVLVLRVIAGDPRDSMVRRGNGQGVVAVFIIAAIGFAIFWFPSWTGMSVPYWFWQLHTPIGSWI